MNRLNDLVQRERARRRRRYLYAALAGLLAGFLLAHLGGGDGSTSRSGPAAGPRPAGLLRLDPERHEAPLARASRTRRAPAHRAGAGQPAARADAADRRALPSGFEAWRHSRATYAVVQCESLRDGSWAWHHGKYRGYYQIGPDEWRDWGGLAFASSPELATRAQQDLVAYRGYQLRGWQPWTCARIVGVYP